MAIVNLTSNGPVLDTGKDNIVIVDHFKSKRGGASLDVTGFTNPVIRAGHVVIKQTSNGEFKPMPTNSAGTAYGSLPAGHTYYGIVINSVLTERPFVGILLSGTVNHKVVDAENGYLDISPILAAVKTAFYAEGTDIKFIGDND